MKSKLEHLNKWEQKIGCNNCAQLFPAAHLKPEILQMDNPRKGLEKNEMILTLD